MSTSCSEICQELLKQAGSIRTMNSEILTKLLTQLMRFGRSAEGKENTNVRTVLARILRGNRARISKVEKTVRKTKKVKKTTRASDPTPNSNKRQLRSTVTVNRSTSPFVKLVNINNAANNETKIKKQASKMCHTTNTAKYPKVYLKNVLTTQGSISKSNFMEYFRLQATGTVPKIQQTNPPNGFIKLSQAVNIPLSSNLGKLLLTKENHVVLEDFKLRKINRAEWYINRPRNAKNGVLEMDSDNSSIPSTSRSPPPDRLNSKRMKKRNALLKLCKPLRVVVKRIDLLETKKKLAINAKNRRRYWYLKNLRLCRKLQVELAIKDKTVVDKFRQSKK